ncbi:hypothetical protein [Kribbella monticola]|uniref:hypothetical protein n=1 Tax=Kribbella monticola TaxID=2185285 RepID=UPI0013001706|nr:hypothetical protein [Kribbella monticola]
MYGRAGIALLALGLPLVVSGPDASAVSTACAEHAVAEVSGRTATDIRGVAPGGRYLSGAAQDGEGNYHAVRWDDGVPTELPIPAAQSWAADVNDDGQLVIGTSDEDGTKPWRYRDGQLAALPIPAGYAGATATAIDNYRGNILGTVSDADGWNVRGVVWDAANHPHVLSIPAGFNEVAVSDIDDDGVAVGTVLDVDIPHARTRYQLAAYWLPDGNVRLFPPSSATAWTTAAAIRHGVAAGQDGDSAATWKVGTNGSSTAIAGGDKAQAINSSGTVVLAGSGRPRVYQPGKGERALSLQDPGGASGGSVAGLTDTNQVYGTDNLHNDPVRWDCS